MVPYSNVHNSCRVHNLSCLMAEVPSNQLRDVKLAHPAVAFLVAMRLYLCLGYLFS